MGEEQPRRNIPTALEPFLMAKFSGHGDSSIEIIADFLDKGGNREIALNLAHMTILFAIRSHPSCAELFIASPQANDIIKAATSSLLIVSSQFPMVEEFPAEIASHLREVGIFREADSKDQIDTQTGVVQKIIRTGQLLGKLVEGVSMRRELLASQPSTPDSDFWNKQLENISFNGI